MIIAAQRLAYVTQTQVRLLRTITNDSGYLLVISRHTSVECPHSPLLLFLESFLLFIFFCFCF